MARLDKVITNRSESRNLNRRYTLRDMAVIKQDEAIINSVIKRGEAEPRKGNQLIVVCGCGVEGCFLHNSYDNDELKGSGLYDHKRKTKT